MSQFVTQVQRIFLAIVDGLAQGRHGDRPGGARAHRPAASPPASDLYRLCCSAGTVSVAPGDDRMMHATIEQ
ncbi:hypothetical protein K4A87_18510 [Xanthomonas fragariae]|nr:hypothetical protein K4A87_18510 [Xanthomonas fragariae]